MLDDFFIRALIAGLGVAIVTGPLGCFTIWRRLSFFGDTLAHSALLGVTLALSFEMNISFAVFLISAVVAIFLINLQRITNLPGDALLGLLAHSTLALGLVTISFLSFELIALESSSSLSFCRRFCMAEASCDEVVISTGIPPLPAIQFITG